MEQDGLQQLCLGGEDEMEMMEGEVRWIMIWWRGRWMEGELNTVTYVHYVEFKYNGE
jgi:hypothetical protein